MEKVHSVFTDMRAGFQDIVFISNSSALYPTKSVLRHLREKVVDDDKKYILLTPTMNVPFPDSEFKVCGYLEEEVKLRVKHEDDTFRGKTTNVFTSLRQDYESGRIVCASVDLWELLMSLDMLEQSGADKIYINYFYQIGQRQHKKRIHESFTAALTLRLAQTSSGGPHILRNVRIIHPHNETSPGFLHGTKVDDYMPIAPATLYFRNHRKYRDRKFVTVGTDAGSLKFNEYLAEAMNAEGTIGIFKDREKAKKPVSVISTGHQYIRDDVVYLFGDDIISTGDTVVNAKRCIESILNKRNGDKNIRNITCCAFITNGCFNTDTANRMRKENIHVVCSDTIYRSEKYLKENADWLSVYSLGYFISDLIICNVLKKGTGMILGEHLKDAQKSIPDLGSILISDNAYDLMRV